jgi:hypothetical protein
VLGLVWPDSAITPGDRGTIVGVYAGMMDGIVVTPVPATSIATVVDPLVILGSLTVTPAPIAAIADTSNPVVVLGSTVARPSPVSAIAAVHDPIYTIAGSAGGQLIGRAMVLPALIGRASVRAGLVGRILMEDQLNINEDNDVIWEELTRDVDDVVFGDAVVSFLVKDGDGVALTPSIPMELLSGTSATYYGVLDSVYAGQLVEGVDYYVEITAVRGAHEGFRRLELEAAYHTAKP